MNTMEILTATFALVSVLMSFVALYVTYEWKILVEKKFVEIDTAVRNAKDCMNDLDSSLFHAKEDLLDLKKDFTNAGIETLHVRSEDHDRAIDSIRRDLLDLQVLTGTLPTQAGTMRQEVENTLESLKSVQSSYLETRAIVDTTKEQVEKLAEAYGSIHFTSDEIEKMRDKWSDMKREVEETLAEMRDYIQECFLQEDKLAKLANEQYALRVDAIEKAFADQA